MDEGMIIRKFDQGLNFHYHVICFSSGGKLCQLGNKWVVNTDGGLESKGHPIGATGLAQCAEIVYQVS